jgi:hypothetical protein
MLKYFVAVLCCAAILLCIIFIVRKIAILTERSRSDEYYRNLNGELNDYAAQNVIYHTVNMNNPRALDHYRAGATYLLNLRNRPAAVHHFNAALTQIIAERHEPGPAVPFILDHIGDLAFAFGLAGDDLPTQEALLSHYSARPKLIAMDDPEKKQKTIIANQDWQIDPQNVHDSALHDTFKQQFMQVVADNSTLPIHDIKEAAVYLKQQVVSGNSPMKTEHIIELLNLIACNAIVPDLQVGETKVLQTIWQRSYDPRNELRRSHIHRALLDACAACIEGGRVVCVTGRTKQLWACLAHLDFNPEIGLFKSKQAIRNEIYQKCASILAKYTGGMSDETKEAFNGSADTPEILKLREEIRAHMIRDITQEYSGLLPPIVLTGVLQSCIDVV